MPPFLRGVDVLLRPVHLFLRYVPSFLSSTDSVVESLSCTKLTYSEPHEPKGFKVICARYIFFELVPAVLPASKYALPCCQPPSSQNVYTLFKAFVPLMPAVSMV